MKATNKEIEKTIELFSNFLGAMHELTVSKHPQYETERLRAKEFNHTGEYIMDCFKSYLPLNVNIPKAVEDFLTIDERQWVEAIPLIGGEYTVACEVNEDGDPRPHFYTSEEEAIQDNKLIADDYLEQINRGEREQGDEWQGEIFECELVGHELNLLKNGYCFYSLDLEKEI